MEIKAIETVYKGYRFRSRTEARWAVFFDSLGLNWEYEVEGFMLPSGEWYLPDFKVEGLGWFEIKALKGNHYTPDPGSKEHKFFEQPGVQGGVLYGLPGPHASSVSLYGPPYTGWAVDSPYIFCECGHCGSIGFQFEGRADRNAHMQTCNRPAWRDRGYNEDSHRMLTAFGAARSARFEHGQTPVFS